MSDRLEALYEKALASEFFRTIENRPMLQFADQDPSTFLPRVQCDSEKGQVDALGRTAGQNQLAATGTEQAEHLLFAFLDHGGNPSTRLMGDAAGVGILGSHQRQHRIDHARIDGRRRMVIEVDFVAWGMFRHSSPQVFEQGSRVPLEVGLREYNPECEAVSQPKTLKLP